jgi:hypothetical protein
MMTTYITADEITNLKFTLQGENVDKSADDINIDIIHVYKQHVLISHMYSTDVVEVHHQRLDQSTYFLTTESPWV